MTPVEDPEKRVKLTRKLATSVIWVSRNMNQVKTLEINFNLLPKASITAIWFLILLMLV
jgi:hypothetical protein